MITFYIIFCLCIINVCSAIVINYDLLVGDMSFYNQTLEFALSEHEKHSTDMLQLIENLMAPWHDDTLANEKN